MDSSGLLPYRLYYSLARMNVIQRIFDGFGWRGFPDALFYQAQYALRFDLGMADPDASDPIRFLLAMDRARAIADVAFGGQRELAAVIWQPGNNSGEPSGGTALDGLHDIGFNGSFGPIEAIRIDSSEDPEDDIFRLWQASEFQYNQRQIAALIWASAAVDLTIQPKAASIGGIYIVDFVRGIALHVYDDRGMDIIARDRSSLQPLYDRFGDWLLDYDRASMDDHFGGK